MPTLKRLTELAILALPALAVLAVLWFTFSWHNGQVTYIKQ
jgi:hypothetical protein